MGCRLCWEAANDDALDNWIDAHGLRIHKVVNGITYTMARELTDAENAEVDEWAKALMEHAEEYWHHAH